MATIDANSPSTAEGSDPIAELQALQEIVRALQGFSTEVQRRIFQSVATFLSLEEMGPISSQRHQTTSPGTAGVSRRFSEDTSMSPKEFLLEKQPRTDVERIACLGFYLTHFRDTPHFKTLDLSKLNTESAQPKFSNAANSTNNAVKRGYLVPAVKGQKQISAAGEQFVRALPDRYAAKAAMATIRPRRRTRRQDTNKPSKPE